VRRDVDTVSVDVPVPPEETVIVVGLRDADGGLRDMRPPDSTVAVRSSPPVNPFRPVKVTVDVPEDPALMVIVVGLVAILKSGGAT